MANVGIGLVEVAETTLIPGPPGSVMEPLDTKCAGECDVGQGDLRRTDCTASAGNGAMDVFNSTDTLAMLTFLLTGSSLPSLLCRKTGQRSERAIAVAKENRNGVGAETRHRQIELAVAVKILFGYRKRIKPCR